MPDQTTRQLVKRYAANTLQAVRVVLVAAVIGVALTYVVTVAGWDVFAVSE